MKKAFIVISITACLILASILANAHLGMDNVRDERFIANSRTNLKYWAQNYDTTPHGKGTEWYHENIETEADKIKATGCGLASAAMVLHPRMGEIYDKRIGETATVVADPYSMYVANGNQTTVQWNFINFDDTWQRIDLSTASVRTKARTIASYLDAGYNPIAYWNYKCNHDNIRRMHFVVFTSHIFDGAISLEELRTILPADAFSSEKFYDPFIEDISPLTEEDFQLLSKAPIPDGPYDGQFEIHDPYHKTPTAGGDYIAFKYNVHRATLDRISSIRILK